MRTIFTKNEPNKCFHILGVDVIFDHKGDPWLLEFNASPSFSIEFNPSGEKGTKFNKTIWPIS